MLLDVTFLVIKTDLLYLLHFHVRL